MDKEQALHSFWSRFNVKAYDENTVYEKAALPYITYEAGTDSFGNSIPLSASVWDRNETSWTTAITIKELISSTIGLGGILVPYDGGAIWIKKGVPFARRMGDPNDSSIRRIVLNIVVEYLSEV